MRDGVGRMRDAKRIPLVISAFEQCWKEVPDWRLGQFIENFKRYVGVDLFYIEDDKIVELLDSFLEYIRKES